MVQEYAKHFFKNLYGRDILAGSVKTTLLRLNHEINTSESWPIFQM